MKEEEDRTTESNIKKQNKKHKDRRNRRKTDETWKTFRHNNAIPDIVCGDYELYEFRRCFFKRCLKVEMDGAFFMPPLSSFQI